jgi:hypothetical protein
VHSSGQKSRVIGVRGGNTGGYNQTPFSPIGSGNDEMSFRSNNSKNSKRN